MTDTPNSTGGSDHGALLRQALRAVEQMRQKLEAAESRARQPIAIVGIGCRFPGEVRDAATFWELLSQGREAICEIPADRWKVDEYYDPDPSTPGKMISRFGGFLNDIDRFDAAFFGIAPREAAMLDPQQRLVLEVAWQALEDAAIAPHSLAETRTGMYLGMASGDYAQLQLQAGDATLLDVHYASGNAHSIASGRLSYLLGLKGPSITVDTACSSSLVAVHLACQALRVGECTVALAGGVNVILAPETTVALSHARMLAPDGRSKAFDDRADGFARAEGCGVVVLKTLSQAEADGDRILAVIRGSALNQDGASSSLTAPHGPSQEELMRRALLDAGIAASQVGYVEAHGTGTELGDPIELRALGSVYGAARPAQHPVLVGSLKTNFGHMEAAAGIGGLIKLVLALQHAEIPAHLQFQTPTRHVRWGQLRLAVPRTATAWPGALNIDQDEGQPLRVGAVSSFGFSGTNAHLIVAQAPHSHDVAKIEEDDSARSPQILPLSARSKDALSALVADYDAWLDSEGSGHCEYTEIAATAQLGRDHFRYRAAVVASSKAEARGLLRELRAKADFGVEVVTPSLCFLFTGQGSERTGMGLELMRTSDVFRAAIERLELALGGSLGKSIDSVWSNEHEALTHASLVQPALYAFGWALSELWRNAGIEPQSVLGHSLGEYIAATVAGVMTPEEGICLVAARGRLTERFAAPGGMVALIASEEKARELVAREDASDLSIAAVNGPESIVVSGRLDAIERFTERLKESLVRHARLRTTHGFHSAALDPMLDAFEVEAQKIAWKVPDLQWISNLTGQVVDRSRRVDAAYWRRHMRQTVQFGQGLAAAEAAGAECYLEIGAEPQLLALAEANGISLNRRVASIPKSKVHGEWSGFQSAAAQLYMRGADLDWKGIAEGRAYRRVPLPGYPFQRKRFWFDDQRQGKRPTAHPGANKALHPLLGSRLRTRNGNAIFQAELSPWHPAHLGEHVVLGRPILPGAAYLEMALAAAKQIDPHHGWAAVDVEVREPCAFDQPLLLETILCPAAINADFDGKRSFEIASCSLQATSMEVAPNWTLHVCGFLERASMPIEDGSRQDFHDLKQDAVNHWDHEAFYEQFKLAGLDFGPAFQPVTSAWGSEDESIVEFDFMPEVLRDAEQYGIHPLMLDACLQAAAAIRSSQQSSAPALPVAVASYRLTGDPVGLRSARAKLVEKRGRSTSLDITGYDSEGRTLLSIRGLTLVEAAEKQYHGCLHEVVWERVPMPEPEDQLALTGPIVIDSAAWEAELIHQARRNDVEAFDTWMSEFDQLCAAWIAGGFYEAGFALTPGRTFDLDELIEAIPVAPQHRRLAARLLDVLKEFAYLGDEGRGSYRVLPRASVDVEQAFATLSQAGHPEIAWAKRAATQLVSLLRGQVNAVDGLFSGEGREMAKRLYRESVSARTLNAALVFAVVEAAGQCSGKVRILEAGGGTAATSSYLLPALAGHDFEYLWTDIGAGFVSVARREFGAIPGLQFQTLDLELDPAGQGLKLAHYDVIVASNVVHATADLRQTLKHLQSLLRPGGLLLMAETVGKQPWIDLTVGLTEGWWRFTDHDLRPAYTLIGKQAWASLLKESGFQDVVLVPNAAEGALGKQCLISAVAPMEERIAREAPSQSEQQSRVLIVTRESAGRADSVASTLVRLAEQSGSVVACMRDRDINADELDKHLGGSSDKDGNGRSHTDVLYLAAIEAQPTTAESSAEEVLGWQQQVLGGALRLVQALIAADCLEACRLWLISSGAFGPKTTAPDGATLAAFARSVRAEFAQASVIAVDIDAGPDSLHRFWALRPSRLQLGTQYALDGSDTWSPRLIRRALSGERPQGAKFENNTRRLHYSASGLLEELEPRIETRQPPKLGEVEIAIHATAINFHEVLSALDSGAQHHVKQTAPGGECAGVVVRLGADVQDLEIGDEVVAIGSGLMADYATLTRDRIWKKPQGMSLEEAATLLIPFLTARWCLHSIARLQAGERVLIHAAAGGVGLAAIQEARRAGAMVFATAGSPSKRDYLRSIGVEAVFDSRSCDFEQGVMSATDFRGVDVVLNSLAGEKTLAGLRALAPRGRFIELGDQGVLSDVEAGAIRPDVTYQRVHLRSALEAASPEVREIITSIVADADNGHIKPLPSRTFSLGDASEAFRFMASGQHTGRVLVSPESGVKKQDGFAEFRRDGTYIVTGGFTGLGLLLVEWLAQRGAGCVLALGRSEPSADALEQFARVEARGAVVLTVRCDVSDHASLANAMGRIPAAFALRGVFHAAGVLDDSALPQQTDARFRAVLSPKVAGAWNLHQLTQTKALDCFVLFSSAAGLLGSRGQSNHAAANAYLDALAQYRRQQLGITALSINWGAWSGAGAAVRHGVVERSERSGASSIAPADGFRLLERLIHEDCTQVLAAPIDWKKWAQNSKAEAAANADLLSNLLRPPTREGALDPHTSGAGAKSSAIEASKAEPETTRSWKDELLAVPDGQRLSLLQSRVEDRVRTVLSFSQAQPIDMTRPLQEYGLDSLLSIEMRNALSADLDVKLPATALFDYPTLAALTNWLFRDVLKMETERAPSVEPIQDRSVFEGVAALSDEEVERLFQQKLAGMQK